MEKEQVEKLLRKVVEEIDTLYRGATRDNYIGSEFLAENLEAIMDGSYFEEPKEESYPYTAYQLQKQLGWESFCNLTGIDYYTKKEGRVIKDSEVFYIKESDVKRYGLH